MTNELEIREVKIRTVDAEKREVSGIAVPWDQDARIGAYYTERFARGAVQDSDGAKLYWRHEEPIGLITKSQDTEAGWEITARISETVRGDEAYTLLRDGVIDKFSVGFEPVEHRDEVLEDDSIVRTRTKVRVKEVSLVPFPAYEGAKVEQVRSAETTNEKEPIVGDTLTRADLDEFRTLFEDLDRKVDGINLTRDAEPKGDVFASIGDMVKRVASGDETAVRAYTGAVSGDTVLKDAWLGSLVEITKARRPILETFSTGPLPSTGMGVEFAVLESDTTQAGVQAAEGDDLLFGKVSITTQTAPVKTIGGWTSLTRQAIERASVPFLDTAWEALVERYGSASEAYARSVLNAAIAATGGTALAEVEADLLTQDGIVAAVLNLAEHFDGTGRSLDGLFVAKDVFLSLYGVDATDRVLQINGQPTDKVGNLTVQTGSGSVANLPFKILPGAAVGSVLAYDKTAIKTLESGGAPFRLQDENIVNLSKDFSLYGYISAAVQKRAGLVKVVPEA